MGSFLQRLKTQEEVSKKQQALLEQQKVTMDAILAQLQQLTKISSNENTNTSRDNNATSKSGVKNKEDNNTEDREEETLFHLNKEANKSKDKVLEDI